MDQTPEEQPSHVEFDQKLLAQKQKIVQLLLDNDDEAYLSLTDYPSQQLQKQLQDQLQQHGQIQTTKTSATLHFGAISNRQFHGLGLLIYRGNQLRFYEGQFQNNCKYGYGLEFIGGDVFVGQFVNNKPEDLNGLFIWANGDIYHGGFINGMKHGLGKWQSGQEFYSGAWKFNHPEGHGYIKSALSEYNGEVRKGYKHGEGLELFLNGDRYEGVYSNGKPEGQGIYAWSNGSLYKGEFRNGLRFGLGVWQYGSEKYEGAYVNDKRHGDGIYHWPAGSHYRGSFAEDLRHGFGQMHWDDHSFYRGHWVEGVQQGDGEIHQHGKIVQRGHFEKGKLVQKGQNDDQLGQDDGQLEKEGRLAPLHPLQPFPRKSQTQRSPQLPAFQPKQQKLSSSQPKQQFNSFHTRQEFYRQEPRKDRLVQQSHSDRQNEAILQRKREINKRYSFYDRHKGENSQGNRRQGERKGDRLHQRSIAQLKGLEKGRSKERPEMQAGGKQEVRASIAKIQLYKKLRREDGRQVRKGSAGNKLVLSFQREVLFENELAPIKWQNFGQVDAR